MNKELSLTKQDFANIVALLGRVNYNGLAEAREGVIIEAKLKARIEDWAEGTGTVEGLSYDAQAIHQAGYSQGYNDGKAEVHPNAS